MKFQLRQVEYIPKDLKPGVLYVAEKYGAAAHLCACGCGTKIRTPLGPTEWKLKVTSKGFSLSPSIGNWQHDCKSHYWINDSEVLWSDQWTTDQIESGRLEEQIRRRAYFAAHQPTFTSTRRFSIWIRKLWPF